MHEIINIVKDIKKDYNPGGVQNDYSAPFSSKGIELDSLAMINIIIRIEKKFSLDMSEAAISGENFKSVAAITDFVQDLMEKKSAAEQQANPIS